MKFFSRTSLFVSCLLLLGVGVSVSRSQEGALSANQSSHLAKHVYTASQFMAELTRLVSTHYNSEGEWELTAQQAVVTPPTEAAVWSLSVTEFPAQPSPYLVLHYKLIADGVIAQENSVLVHASLWKMAWVTRHPLSARSIFDASSLDTQRVDSFTQRDIVAASAGDNTYAYTHDIRADSLITWHDLARRPLVKKGDIVDVIATEGMLSVSMKALAMENGVRGDLVTVRNLETRKDISGIVVSDDRVEVHF
jgi:flagella basal body P-ring formation protein FlgA